MMTKRYEPDWHRESTLSESDTGDYVLYEEYEALESDYNVLRRDYESLQAGLKKLYLES